MGSSSLPSHLVDTLATLPTERLQAATQLIKASSQGDLASIKGLLEKGADAWVQDECGWTCLHHGANTGDAILVKTLLDGGAPWNITDNIGFTAGDVAFSLNHASAYDEILQFGIRFELLQAALESHSDDDDEEVEDHTPGTLSSASHNPTYLRSKLTYVTDETGQERCLDAEGNGVMMGWEAGIMQKTAQLLCKQRDPDSDEFVVMNVGFGLGLVDTELQKYKPTKHVIIEAHPDVLQYMRSKGWYDRPGVRIFEGRWQDYMKKVEEGEEEAVLFDAIYWDTFSEHYADLRQFFDVVPNYLRDENSLFSFFHGLGAGSRLFYDVYTVVSEMHLKDVGLSTAWTDVPIKDGGELVWKGVTRRYWDSPTAYRLPICKTDV